MSIKLKFNAKPLDKEAKSSENIKRGKWMEYLRLLRESLDETFQSASRCIDRDIEKVLLSSDENLNDWDRIRQKYVNLSERCLELLLELSLESASSYSKTESDLRLVKKFFKGHHRLLPTRPKSYSGSEPGKFKSSTSKSNESSRSECNSETTSVSVYKSKKSSKKNVRSQDSTGRTSETTNTDIASSSVVSAEEDSGRNSPKSSTSVESSKTVVRFDLSKSAQGETNVDSETQTLTTHTSTKTKEPKDSSKWDYSSRSTRHCEKSSQITDRRKVSTKMDRSSKLLIFDRHGNPLTDQNGAPLLNMNREVVIKYRNNKPICHISGEPVFDENGLPFVSSLKEPLHDVLGNPLRLFNQDNVPLTDPNGLVSKLKDGTYCVLLDEFNRIQSDKFGSPIYNDRGEVLVGKECDPLAPLFQCEGNPIPLYNSKGFLLTDENGQSLTASNGDKLIKIGPSGELMDLFGEPVFDAEGNPVGNKPTTPTLRIFDANKFPLTDDNGIVLLDADGNPLVNFDPCGKPISDNENRVVFDSKNVPSSEARFCPYTSEYVKVVKRFRVSGIKLFNSKKRPMLDLDGSPLYTSDGKPVIVVVDKKILHDVLGNPLFDETGIPVAQLNGAWVCPSGAPYRVFDGQGRPLTDKKGRSLHTINDESLLRLDNFGRPVITWMKGPVCDAKLVSLYDPDFDPTSPPPNDDLRMQVFVNDSPLKVFDRFGKPLSDSDGMAMVDAKGRCLLQFNEAGKPVCDFVGATIYDQHRLPLGCKASTAIVSMSGLPFRIFDINKRPLTNKNGVPLTLANDKPLIKFDSVGRPVSDLTGGPLLDYQGRKLSGDQTSRGDSVLPEMDLIIQDTNGKPFQLFDANGWPLTDDSGAILVNADGTHLQLDFHGNPVADCNGKQLYDQFGTALEEILLRTGRTFVSPTENREALEKDSFGRVLKDSKGSPQFDTYGRPLYDLYRRPMFDSTGCPISDASGRMLSDGKNEPTFKLPFDLSIFSASTKPLDPKSDKFGLLRDLLGGPLFDPDGLPLYNEHGKPILDMYGRDLYDLHGNILCESNGKPSSKQVKAHLKERNATVEKVTDSVKMIKVPKELVPMLSSSLAVGKRVADGVVVPASCIVNNWHKASRHSRTYWALLRETKLSDGFVILEVLKALEINDSKQELSLGDSKRTSLKNVFSVKSIPQT